MRIQIPSQLPLGPLDEAYRLRLGGVQYLGQQPGGLLLRGGLSAASAVRLVALGGLDGDGEDEAVAAGEAPRQTGRARGDELDLEDDLVDGGGGGGCLPIADVVNLGAEGAYSICKLAFNILLSDIKKAK